MFRTLRDTWKKVTAPFMKWWVGLFMLPLFIYSAWFQFAQIEGGDLRSNFTPILAGLSALLLMVVYVFKVMTARIEHQKRELQRAIDQIKKDRSDLK